ncbi:hypothetical protein GCM10007036_22280 [Alsobacter metallidurans]|uniref:HMA domain-containing protein n=1 Tax=Alsobacter metallidurans TaxID=340221 RepID=A0A917I6G0_9HYPH|nr:cation transporter [Alsobacter metallidurans]GGH19402.1 hypothetical protein GCM10007036_22280 [Alsobacter metallidurans]
MTANSKAAMTHVGAEVVRVRDMRCGRCVAAITGAIQAKWPFAAVRADLAGETISVSGMEVGADLRGVIRAAGYTPAG